MFSKPEKNFYSRHFLLKDVGLEGQSKLKEAKIVLIGAGGLGCPIAMYLAAAGVGKITVIDDDTVDMSNLHRQVLYNPSDVGELKVEVLKKRLQAQNPFIEIDALVTRFSSDNATEILAGADLLIDGSDNFPTRYLANDASYLCQIPLVFGAIQQFTGQVSLFNSSQDAPCYRCLFSEAPEPGDIPNCAEAGVLGVLPGMIGSMMAAEALKHLLKIGDSLSGHFVTCDALSMEWQKFRLPKLDSCNLCGEAPTITEIKQIEYQGCQINMGITAISVQDLKKKMDANEDIYLLDVRELEEWEICRIDGASLIPMREMPTRMQEVPKDKEIVVYCHLGMRSLRVAEFLESEGWSNLHNLSGGVHSWALEIDDTVALY